MYCKYVWVYFQKKEENLKKNFVLCLYRISILN